MFKKIGIIREGKVPPDRRVPLTPEQCREARLQGIDIAVQKKVQDGDQNELDDLMLLVEQIADLFKLRRLTDLPGARWTKTENTPIYAPEYLEQKHCFVSVLTLTYRLVR